MNGKIAEDCVYEHNHPSTLEEVNNEYFKEQLASGATEMFFYGIIYDDDSIVIERHRGYLKTMSLDGLVYDHTMRSIPFFKLELKDEQT